MSNQVGPDTFGGIAPEPGTFGGGAPDPGLLAYQPGPPDQGVHHAYHGRPVSWVAVSIIMLAFVIGGVALVFGPTWWLFWASLGLAVAGGLLALATNIFEDWY